MSIEWKEVHELLDIVHKTKDFPNLRGLTGAAMRKLEEHHTLAVKENTDAAKKAADEAAKAKAAADAKIKAAADKEALANNVKPKAPEPDPEPEEEQVNKRNVA